MYEHIPISTKKIVNQPDVGHGLFSHGVIKHETVKNVDEWF